MAVVHVFIKTEIQKQRLKKIGELADKFAEKAHFYDETGTFPIENINALKEYRYPTFTLPEKYGGIGISLYEFLLYQERLAQGCGSTALSIGWHLGIIYDLNVENTWHPESFTNLMKEINNNKLINAASSEAITGSPTRGGRPLTTAKQTSNGWTITGRKIYTTLSPVVDYFIVTASVEGSEQVGQFLVPATSKGLTIEETWDSISMKATGSHDLVLDKVKIDAQNLLTILDKKKRKANGWLLHIPACYLGIAQAAKEYSINFAQSYIPNSINHPISDLPNIKRLIGEIELEIRVARHFLYSVAEKWDQVEDRIKLVPELGAVKYNATNTAISVVDKAMRIVGARSLSSKNPLQRFYRDVRAGLHNPPMDDSTISLLAEDVLNQPIHR